MTVESKLVREGPDVRVNCEECEQPLPPRTHASGQPRRFCSARCRDRAGARKRRRDQLGREGPDVRVGPKRKRRPLPEVSSDAAWSLRRDVERIERIFADDRFGSQKEEVTALLRGHLSYAAEVCQDLLGRINRSQGE